MTRSNDTYNNHWTCKEGAAARHGIHSSTEDPYALKMQACQVTCIERVPPTSYPFHLPKISIWKTLRSHGQLLLVVKDTLCVDMFNVGRGQPGYHLQPGLCPKPLLGGLSAPSQEPHPALMIKISRICSVLSWQPCNCVLKVTSAQMQKILALWNFIAYRLQ